MKIDETWATTPVSSPRQNENSIWQKAKQCTDCTCNIGNYIKGGACSGTTITNVNTATDCELCTCTAKDASQTYIDGIDIGPEQRGTAIKPREDCVGNWVSGTALYENRGEGSTPILTILDKPDGNFNIAPLTPAGVRQDWTNRGMTCMECQCRIDEFVVVDCTGKEIPHEGFMTKTGAGNGIINMRVPLNLQNHTNSKAYFPFSITNADGVEIIAQDFEVFLRDGTKPSDWTAVAPCSSTYGSLYKAECSSVTYSNGVAPDPDCNWCYWLDVVDLNGDITNREFPIYENHETFHVNYVPSLDDADLITAPGNRWCFDTQNRAYRGGVINSENEQVDYDGTDDIQACTDASTLLDRPLCGFCNCRSDGPMSEWIKGGQTNNHGYTIPDNFEEQHPGFWIGKDLGNHGSASIIGNKICAPTSWPQENPETIYFPVVAYDISVSISNGDLNLNGVTTDETTNLIPGLGVVHEPGHGSFGTVTTANDLEAAKKALLDYYFKKACESMGPASCTCAPRTGFGLPATDGYVDLGYNVNLNSRLKACSTTVCGGSYPGIHSDMTKEGKVHEINSYEEARALGRCSGISRTSSWYKHTITKHQEQNEWPESIVKMTGSNWATTEQVGATSDLIVSTADIGTDEPYNNIDSTHVIWQDGANPIWHPQNYKGFIWTYTNTLGSAFNSPFCSDADEGDSCLDNRDFDNRDSENNLIADKYGPGWRTKYKNEGLYPGVVELTKYYHMPNAGDGQCNLCHCGTNQFLTKPCDGGILETE